MLIFHGNTLCQGLLAATLGPRGKLAVHRVNAVGGREERGRLCVGWQRGERERF